MAKHAGYESTFITRPELSAEGLKTIQEKLNEVIRSFDGELILSEEYDRKLAYPIQKESRGHYTYLVYTGKSGVVHEVERNLRLHEHVLRFLTVNLAQEFDAEQFNKTRAEVHAAAKKREEEREARREERAERRSYGDERRHDGFQEESSEVESE